MLTGSGVKDVGTEISARTHWGRVTATDLVLLAPFDQDGSYRAFVVLHCLGQRSYVHLPDLVHGNSLGREYHHPSPGDCAAIKQERFSRCRITAGIDCGLAWVT